MKVTGFPGQKGLGVALIDTPAGRVLLTIIVIVFDVAGFPLVQSDEEVKMQVTTSPFIGV